jgi:hypothetical protein
MLRKKSVLASVGVILLLIVTLTTLMRPIRPASAADPQGTPIPTPQTGATFTYNDPDTSQLDTATVTSTQGGLEQVDVTAPAGSGQPGAHFVVQVVDPNQPSSSTQPPPLRVAQQNPDGTLTFLPSPTLDELASEDQLQAGTNSTMTVVDKGKAKYYQDGYTVNTPLPPTSGRPNVWDIQVYDNSLGRLRTMQVVETPGSSGSEKSLDTIRSLVNSINLAQNGLVTSVFRGAQGAGATFIGLGLVQKTENKRINAAIAAALALVFVAGLLYNLYTQITQYHQQALITFNRIIQNGHGFPHELSPIQATPTPVPAPAKP